MATQKISASRNGWVQSSQPNSVRIIDAGDDDELLVGGWGDFIMTVIGFDISSLPSDIISAKIGLYLWNKAATSIKWSRIEADWSESTITWNNRPSGVTNNVGTSVTLPDVNNFLEIDITTLYNQWKDGTYTNYGISINGGQSSYSNIYNAFRPRAYTTEAQRPYLEIEYTPTDTSKFFQLF